MNPIEVAVQAPNYQVHKTLSGYLSITGNSTGQEQKQQIHVAELFSGREFCEFKDVYW